MQNSSVPGSACKTCLRLACSAYVRAYLMYMPTDHISRGGSVHKTQELICRLCIFFLKQMPQSSCAVAPNNIALN